MDGELGGGGVDFGEVGWGELDVGGGYVFLQAVELGGAGDGDHPGLLGEDPGEGDLGGGGVVALGDGFEEGDEGAVGGAGFGGEAGDGIAEIGGGEGRGFVDFSSEEAFAKGAKGDEADAEFFEGGENFGFGFAPPDGVFALEGGDGLDGVGAADGFDAGFGEAEVFYFTLLDEVFYGAGDVFDGDGGVDTVLVEEVDGFDVETL